MIGIAGIFFWMRKGRGGVRRVFNGGTRELTGKLEPESSYIVPWVCAVVDHITEEAYINIQQTEIAKRKKRQLPNDPEHAARATQQH
jgi:hypothetical protein